MKTRKLLFVLLVAVAASMAAITTGIQNAIAQASGVHLVQLGCDTLSFDPPRVRVTYSVINFTAIPVCSIHLIPLPAGPYQPCEIFECSVPDFWQCHLEPGGGAGWQTVSPYCIRPFDKVDGFDFVIDPPYCCYRALFDDPNGQIFYETIVCFQCESPVGTKSESWGKLKLKYR